MHGLVGEQPAQVVACSTEAKKASASRWTMLRGIKAFRLLTLPNNGNSLFASGQLFGNTQVMAGTECPFCNLDPKRIVLSTQNMVARFDGYPVTQGHTLVIPRRHIGSIFDLSEPIQAEIWSQVAKVRAILLERFGPDGFNIGVNDGTAAGQTINHAHSAWKPAT